MQIKELEIKNFKGISELKFSPKKFNVIVGRNNTGKTSVLEAINILVDPDKLKFYCITDEYEYIQNIIHALEKFSVITAICDSNEKEKLKISYVEDEETIEIIEDFRKNLVRALTDEFIVALKEKKKEDIKNIRKKISEKVENRIDEIINFKRIMQIVKENKKNIIKIVKNTEKEFLYDPYVFKNEVILIKTEELKKLKVEIEHAHNLIFEKLFYEFIEELYREKENIKSDYIVSTFAKHIILGIKFYKYHKSADKITFQAIMMKCGQSLERQVKRRIGRPIYAMSIYDIPSMTKEESDKEKKEKIRKIEEIIKEHKLLENLDRLDLDYVSFKVHNKKDIVYIPFSFLGDGLKVMIYILWNLVSPNMDIKDKIVLLDEPETNMHPGYIIELLKMLIKFSDKQNIQFFITTHSGDFIDVLLNKECFSKEEQKYLDEELLMLRMGKTGEFSVFKSYNYEEAEYTRNELLLDLRGI